MAWRWISIAIPRGWTSRRRWRASRTSAAAISSWTPTRTRRPNSPTCRWLFGWHAGPGSRRTASSTSGHSMNLRWPSNDDADRDHDRRPGGVELGALAAHLPRHRHPRLRVATAERPPDLPHVFARSRMHRVLDLARPGRGMDEEDRVRSDGEPDDVSAATRPGEDRGCGRCPFRRPADPRSRGRVERKRAPRVRHPLLYGTRALRAARHRHQ